MTTKDEDNTKQAKSEAKAPKVEAIGDYEPTEADLNFGKVDLDDPTLNTYDIDTQGADRHYPARKPRPAEAPKS